jgi:hypothetical protein
MQVLDADDAGHAAVLVDDERERRARRLQPSQRVDEAERLGQRDDRTGSVGDRPLGADEVHHPDDAVGVVEPLGVDGRAAVTARDELAERLRDRRVSAVSARRSRVAAAPRAARGRRPRARR